MLCLHLLQSFDTSKVILRLNSRVQLPAELVIVGESLLQLNLFELALSVCEFVARLPCLHNCVFVRADGVLYSSARPCHGTRSIYDSLCLLLYSWECALVHV